METLVSGGGVRYTVCRFRAMARKWREKWWNKKKGDCGRGTDVLNEMTHYLYRYLVPILEK
jgi:hypothetical protein